MNAPVTHTPTGRVPGTPLRNRKHERLSAELACGKHPYEAVKLAGALNPNGSSFESNARRLCQRADIRERVNEIAAQEIDLAGIHAGWLLEDAKLFARSSLSRFFKRDENGKLLVDGRGNPTFDFSQVDDTDLRLVKKARPTKYGVEYEVHDPLPYIDRLGRYLGLWTGEAAASASASASIGLSDLTDDELLRILSTVQAHLVRNTDHAGVGEAGEGKPPIPDVSGHGAA